MMYCLLILTYRLSFCHLSTLGLGDRLLVSLWFRMSYHSKYMSEKHNIGKIQVIMEGRFISANLAVVCISKLFHALWQL